jgi:hypothetical protein
MFATLVGRRKVGIVTVEMYSNGVISAYAWDKTDELFHWKFIDYALHEALDTFHERLAEHNAKLYVDEPE